MRVFMLGWEFPPFISGGLGTACFGLTRALRSQQVQVLFVLPRATTENSASHVRLLSPRNAPHAIHADGPIDEDGQLADITFKTIPTTLRPYGLISQIAGMGKLDPLLAGEQPSESEADAALPSGTHYGGNLLQEARRYASLCAELARHESFEVIHAHDWLTFPAGMAVARLSGKPLVVHVHSTEFDRAGENINQQVYDIERRGMHAACRVVCVSYLTASIVQHRYGVSTDKIDVVYNGIDNPNGRNSPAERAMIRKGDKIVLFLGRITMQKGPEYFVMAAKKVLEKFQNVKFIMAGSGDKLQDVMSMAKAQGIATKILFTGFLRGKDVQRVFEMADVYVMPSVSEPFGIAPLEAISHDVPVIISKQSGVSEVLQHALKVDFWDTDEMANKILAVLRHPPLGSTLREQADIEVRSLTWDGAAARCRSVYKRAIAAMG